uniref:Uncharacterized protein n=1 Tax=Cyanothece sp. (strain PCC 7425 / ATCC 29141) TaxID=395961 RepID=B8HM66_CYAP4
MFDRAKIVPPLTTSEIVSFCDKKQADLESGLECID